MVRSKLRFCVTCCKHVISAVGIIIVLFIYLNSNNCKNNILTEFSNKSRKYLYFEKAEEFHSLNEVELRRWIESQNAQENILNLDLYGHVTNDTFIFVIQVHKFSCTLNYLLASLYELKGIQDALIIFSHSRLDNNVINLIQSIDFCRVLQLFYPYSIQAYPDSFPGYTRNDCPPNLNVQLAKKLNCTGSQYPDIHGRYRNPIQAEKKHQWWWTANKVFQDLSCTVGHKGIVVFLENDFLLMKDLIFFARRMKMIAASLPQCKFLSLGTTSVISGDNLYQVEFTTWDPKYHSNVLAMDISTWNSIESHYDLFCLIDDYSWSRSLLYISLNRRDGKRFKVLSSKAPRALQTTTFPCIGEVINCDVMETILHTLNLQKKHEERWIPPFIEVYNNIELEDDDDIIFDHMENNGGWNDLRDKQLCSNMTLNKAQKYILNMDID